jgi:hypothetical protein
MIMIDDLARSQVALPCAGGGSYRWWSENSNVSNNQQTLPFAMFTPAFV